jgi:predicted phage terminase large subunit-like protein
VEDIASLPVHRLIPKLSPNLTEPHHLREWCDLIERAAHGESVRAMCAVPIRHYKSETTNHGAIRLLLRDPTNPIIHLSHSFDRAQTIGKRIRMLAESCDKQFGTNIGPARGQNTIADWRNDRGGGVVVMSADQSKLGYDCGTLLVDDPIDEHGSKDKRIRDEVDETISHYTARCMRHGKPGPVFLLMSPWHIDDPRGRRKTRTAREWVDIRYPAVLHEGTDHEEAFAPSVWSLAELYRVKAELREQDPTERIWWAQFMCDPRPPSADLFRDPQRYTALPDLPFRVAYGADFAFTSGTGSDYFALVVARLYGRKAYVTEVYRHKIDAHQIESTIRMVQHKHGAGVVWTYQSGPEVGLTSILVERGLKIARMPARYNKLVRAERTVRRWNDGEIVIPHESYGALWAPGFMARVANFRGNDKDGDDDEIDALVSLCDGALGGASAPPSTCGKPGYSGL